MPRAVTSMAAVVPVVPVGPVVAMRALSSVTAPVVDAAVRLAEAFLGRQDVGDEVAGWHRPHVARMARERNAG